MRSESTAQNSSSAENFGSNKNPMRSPPSAQRRRQAVAALESVRGGRGRPIMG
jgi:hypothetical protein